MLVGALDRAVVLGRQLQLRVSTKLSVLWPIFVGEQLDDLWGWGAVVLS